MNVLMIPSFFKNNKNTSSGSFFLEQGLIISKTNKVIIIYPDVYSLKHIRDYLNYKEKNETIENVEIIRKKMLAPFKFHEFGCRRAFVKACLQLLEEKMKNGYKCDIIHAQNSIWAGEAARIINKKYHIPYVITEHSSFFATGSIIKKMFFYHQLKLIFNNSSKIICVSENLKKCIVKYNKNVEAIGNVVDIFNYNIKQNMRSNNYFKFITVAYLTTENRIYMKGIIELLINFASLIQNNENIVLEIVGVPKNDIYLHKIVKEYNLEKNIILMEPLSKEDISIQMNTSHCFILLSRYETFGLVYAEAMSTGLPVIATDVGITKEIVNDDTGIICDIKDNKSIVNSMDYIIKNYHKYDKNKIRKTIIDRYSDKIIAQKINDIYKSVI